MFACSEHVFVDFNTPLHNSLPAHCRVLVIGGCAPPVVSNGAVVEKSGGFIPGDRAVIQCDDGYVLMPRFAKPVIICNKDGTWTAEEVDLPVCVGKQRDHWCRIYFRTLFSSVIKRIDWYPVCCLIKVSSSNICDCRANFYAIRFHSLINYWDSSVGCVSHRLDIRDVSILAVYSVGSGYLTLKWHIDSKF